MSTTKDSINSVLSFMVTHGWIRPWSIIFITSILLTVSLPNFQRSLTIHIWSLKIIHNSITLPDHVLIILQKLAIMQLKVLSVMVIMAEFGHEPKWSYYNCWPYWASNKYLAGPIGPANDPLHCKGSLAGPMGPAKYLLLAQCNGSLAGLIGPARCLLLAR